MGKHKKRRKPKFIWMKVTEDKYEFPICMADTEQELSDMCGVKPPAIYLAIKKAEKANRRCRYARVPVEEEE